MNREISSHVAIVCYIIGISLLLYMFHAMGSGGGIEIDLTNYPTETDYHQARAESLRIKAAPYRLCEEISEGIICVEDQMVLVFGIKSITSEQYDRIVAPVVDSLLIEERRK